VAYSARGRRASRRVRSATPYPERQPGCNSVSDICEQVLYGLRASGGDAGAVYTAHVNRAAGLRVPLLFTQTFSSRLSVTGQGQVHVDVDVHTVCTCTVHRRTMLREPNNVGRLVRAVRHVHLALYQRLPQRRVRANTASTVQYFE
jgi:hypothetical protein